jgi:hypothetical protein
MVMLWFGNEFSPLFGDIYYEKGQTSFIALRRDHGGVQANSWKSIRWSGECMMKHGRDTRIYDKHRARIS